MDFNHRLGCLFKSMVDANLSGLVYGVGANFQYFTGAVLGWERENEPKEPDSFLVLSQSASTPVLVITLEADVGRSIAAEVPVLMVKDRSEAASSFGKLLAGKRIGVGRQASEYLTELILSSLPNAECLDADELGSRMRCIKDPEEVRRLKHVAALTDRVMGEVVRMLKPGVTQIDLQRLIAETGFRLGAQDISFPPLGLYVKSGTEREGAMVSSAVTTTVSSMDPFTYPRDKGLVPGTSIAFDFGFVLDGYCSDFGRSFYWGSPSERISAAYQALQAAQCHLISMMKPGLRIGEMTGIVLSTLDEFGVGDRFRARQPCGNIGHQIGVALHEDPRIEPGCELLLEAGMVMCIEPKVWLPGEYYLRVEDMVLVTENGAESLTKYDRNMFQLSHN